MATESERIVRTTLVLRRLVYAAPYREWPAIAMALGWAQDRSDPSWMTDYERRFFWDVVTYETEAAAKARRLADAILGFKRALWRLIP